jgi:ribonuclease HI
VKSIKRFNMAPHPTCWTSKSAVLRHNPETTRSTADVEAKGLLVGIDEWFPEGRMREHIHVLDNQAVLHQISTPSRSKNNRHAFREYNHFTIDEIRRKVNRINYYEKNPADKTIFVNWIKGHSGNKLHECADRHAARAAFRPINGPSRKPNESKYPCALYFYECLITGDVRKHAKQVCQEIHLRK